MVPFISRVIFEALTDEASIFIAVLIESPILVGTVFLSANLISLPSKSTFNFVIDEGLSEERDKVLEPLATSARGFSSIVTVIDCF